MHGIWNISHVDIQFLINALPYSNVVLSTQKKAIQLLSSCTPAACWKRVTENVEEVQLCN